MLGDARGVRRRLRATAVGGAKSCAPGGRCASEAVADRASLEEDEAEERLRAIKPGFRTRWTGTGPWVATVWAD